MSEKTLILTFLFSFFLFTFILIKKKKKSNHVIYLFIYLFQLKKWWLRRGNEKVLKHDDDEGEGRGAEKETEREVRGRKLCIPRNDVFLYLCLFFIWYFFLN